VVYFVATATKMEAVLRSSEAVVWDCKFARRCRSVVYQLRSLIVRFQVFAALCLKPTDV
jgi:hypothetical protein